MSPVMPVLEPENTGHLPPRALGAEMLPGATAPFLNDGAAMEQKHAVVKHCAYSVNIQEEEEELKVSVNCMTDRLRHSKAKKKKNGGRQIDCVKS